MTNSTLRHVLVALALAIPTWVQGQNPRSYPLAVLPFIERGKETKDLGPKVTDLLFAKLASDTGIVLVEREREDFRFLGRDMRAPCAHVLVVRAKLIAYDNCRCRNGRAGIELIL